MLQIGGWPRLRCERRQCPCSRELHQSGQEFRCITEPSIQNTIEGADICVICTTPSSPALTNDYELKGSSIAAIGADSTNKQENAPALMLRSRLLVDDLDADAAGGDLYHVLKSGCGFAR